MERLIAGLVTVAAVVGSAGQVSAQSTYSPTELQYIQRSTELLNNAGYRDFTRWFGSNDALGVGYAACMYLDAGKSYAEVVRLAEYDVNGRRNNYDTIYVVSTMQVVAVQTLCTRHLPKAQEYLDSIS